MDKKSNETPVRRLRMEDELWNSAERVAQDQDRSVSWVIRKALEEYIDRYRAAKREAKQVDAKIATKRDRKR
jgi:predicted transcriptional regulator